MYGLGFADQREELVVHQSLWIIHELKQNATDNILSATKLIRNHNFNAPKVLSWKAKGSPAQKEENVGQ